MTESTKINMIRYYFYNVFGNNNTSERLVIASIVAAVLAIFEVWPSWCSILWLLFYMYGELEFFSQIQKFDILWAEPDLATSAKLRNEIVLVTSYIFNLGSIPCVLCAIRGGEASLVGILICGTALTIVAAQHSLTKYMFFYTSSVVSLALILNIMSLSNEKNKELFVF